MHSSVKKLCICLTALLVLLIIGAAGYHVLGDHTLLDSIYFALVVLTTVGMRESNVVFNEAERIWTILLMLVGIGTVLYTTGIIVAFFVEGTVTQVINKRRDMQNIHRIKDHTIIVGYGRMGKALAHMMQNESKKLVIVEADEAKVKDAENEGFLVLARDAHDEETLEMAGIHRACALATCLGNDADNVFITLSARDLNSKLSIIARAEELRTEGKLRYAGADEVLCPAVTAATHMFHFVNKHQHTDKTKS